MALPDVAVIGGGAIGCAVAWELSRRGLRVVVIERDVPGRGATWAAGGMLSPLSEAAGTAALMPLANASLDLWPAFAARIAEAVHIDVEYRPAGKLHIAYTTEGMRALEQLHAHGSGFGVQLLTPDEALALEPAISPDIAGGLLVGRDHRVNPRLLGEALWRCAEQSGVEIRRGVSACRMESQQNTVTVVLADGARVSVGACIIAAGAWSGLLEGLPRALPVRPVRGQMFAVERPRGEPQIQHVIEAPDCYTVPRESGRIVVGATAELAGFETGPTPSGLAPLLQSAVRAVPALADLPLVETWAGFRPGTPDDLPILGPDPAAHGVYHATGHYRNGVLLAPITAEIIANLVTGAPPPLPLDAYRPDRF